jgi:sugar phosphate isomerase/epimerase
MYKVINLKGLGVAGRQNELIELALTHKFSGVEVDMSDLLGRHDALGKNFACQFLQSANMDLGTFDLPIEFGASDADFATACEQLDTVIDLATTLKASRCRVQISPNSDDTAFQENFDKHCTRISEVAEKLAPANIKIGLSLQASKAQEADGNFKFIQTAEEIVTLCKSVGHSNVGICLDLFEWQVGGGGMDQISELAADTVTEVCMADLPADADPATVKEADRALPCAGGDHLSLKVAQHLLSNQYAGAYSISTDLATFANGSRHRVVAGLSTMLDKLGLGEDPTPVVESEEDGEESTEEGEGTTDEAKSDKPAEAKSDKPAEAKSDKPAAEGEPAVASES